MAEKKNGDTTTPAAHASEPKPAAAPKVKMTKMEAVKRAIKALGTDAPRGDLQKHIKSEFNIDMTADHISNYKGEIKRREAKGRKKSEKTRDSKTAPQAGAVTAPAPAAAAVAPPAKRDNVGAKIREAIHAARGLIALVGAKDAKELIDDLAP